MVAIQWHAHRFEVWHHMEEIALHQSTVFVIANLASKQLCECKFPEKKVHPQDG
jgi:hypothetical protein